jgi:hypothetical protein
MTRMSVTKFKILVALFFLVPTLSCSNVFTPYLAETDTDRALLYEARQLVDLKKYGSAQTVLRQMTSAYFEQREVQVLYASTYAGLCGLDVIQLILNLSAGSATSTFFQLLFAAFADGTVASVANCNPLPIVNRPKLFWPPSSIQFPALLMNIF